jgi:hypothetical protein
VKDKRDPFIVYNLSREFAHKLHYFEVGTDLEEILGSTRYHHLDSGIPNTGFILVLLDHG